MNYEIFNIGEVRDEWKNQGTIVRASYDGIWSLTVGFNGITPREIKELQHGDVRATYTIIDDSLFLLFKIGEFEWFDAPYEPRLNHDTFTTFEKGKGAPLVIYTVDTKEGKLHGIRMLGMGNKFSNLLHDTCRNMKGTVTPEENAKRVTNIYTHYPTTYSMLQTAEPDHFFLLLKHWN